MIMQDITENIKILYTSRQIVMDSTKNGIPRRDDPKLSKEIVYPLSFQFPPKVEPEHETYRRGDRFSSILMKL